MLLNCGAAEDPWESLGLQGDQTSHFWRKSTLNWKDWGWSWSSNTLATWWEEPTHQKRSWCWERLRAGEEGGNRGWDGWMASPTQCTWIWANSGRQWKTGKPAVLQSMGLQRVGHDWVTEKQHVRLWKLDHKESWVPKICCFQIVVLEKTPESPLDSKRDQTSQSYRKSILNIHWKDWGWSWSSNTLVTW